MKARPDIVAALKLLDKGAAAEALAIAEMLADSRDGAVRISGLICKGLVYEHGGQGVPMDLGKALHCYRSVALVTRDADTFCDMARVLLKQGGEQCEAGHRYLLEAARSKHSPEVSLGFAEYYRSRPVPDLSASRAHYLKAALAGRFRGFFGYSEISRKLGQPWRALGMDCLRLVLGPAIALLLGSKAQGRF